ncbi:MAG: SIS domain-containing protein [bacterium]|nr:SIS domain-containing protein [bacterium]
MNSFIDCYFEKIKQTLDNIDRNELKDLAEILLSARDMGKHIYIMGNGGSASTASHFVCDFNKGIHTKDDKHFNVRCLNDNIPTMLAYANDLSYDDLFVEQLKNFLEPYDVVIALSGSGNSTNVLKAIDYANSKRAITVGITGYNGGKLKEIASVSVNTNIDDMQISEDVHLIITHLLFRIISEMDSLSVRTSNYMSSPELIRGIK